MKVLQCKKEHLTTAAEILVEAWFDTVGEAKEFLTESIEKKTCYVAMDKEVIGVMVYQRDYSHYANYLSDIVVAKSHRRKGVAKLLMEKYIEVSREETPSKQKLALSSTDIDNKVSMALHKKLGFKIIGTMKGLHYGKDEYFFGYEL